MKTQTRRIVKPQPAQCDGFGAPPKYDATRAAMWGGGYPDHGRLVACPYGQPGDRLWVKETWAGFSCPRHDEGQPPGTRCDCGLTDYRADANLSGRRWRPSIFMPRSRSRITLELTAVRVERLCDISEADAIAEGVNPVQYDAEGDCWTASETARLTPHRAAYEYLWGELNGFDSWAANPWVWVLSFKRVTGPLPEGRRERPILFSAPMVWALLEGR